MFRLLSLASLGLFCVTLVIPNFRIIFDPNVVFSSPLKQCYKGLLNFQMSLQDLSVLQLKFTLFILTSNVNSLTYAGENIIEHWTQILTPLLAMYVALGSY